MPKKLYSGPLCFGKKAVILDIFLDLIVILPIAITHSILDESEIIFELNKLKHFIYYTDTDI